MGGYGSAAGNVVIVPEHWTTGDEANATVSPD